MKLKNRWFFLILTGSLIGSTFLGTMRFAGAAPTSEVAAQTAKVSINKANTSELESVRGIGPMLAQRIVQNREANGRFENLEDLVRVPGIGQAKLERMKDQLTL